jgi:hypothetical protein
MPHYNHKISFSIHIFHLLLIFYLLTINRGSMTTVLNSASTCKQLNNDTLGTKEWKASDADVRISSSRLEGLPAVTAAASLQALLLRRKPPVHLTPPMDRSVDFWLTVWSLQCSGQWHYDTEKCKREVGGGDGMETCN